MNWRRIAVTGLVLAGVTGVLAFSPVAFHAYKAHSARAKSVVRPRPVTDADQREIVRVLLATNDYYGIPPPPPWLGRSIAQRNGLSIVVLRSAIPLCAIDSDSVDAERGCDWHGHLISGILPSARDADSFLRVHRRELVAANLTGEPIPLPSVAGMQLATSDEIARIFAGGSKADDPWQHFYKRYPNTGGLLGTTRAVYTEDTSHALIYIHHMCDGLCGTGYLHLLARSKGGWLVERSYRVWVS